MNDPNGEQYEIAAGPYRAIVTEAGAGLRVLTHDDRPLILSHPAGEPAPAAFGQLLIPWANRIDHGRYDYDGQTHQLDISEPDRDCAIHGLTRWATWREDELAPHRIRMTHRLLARAGYPFRLDLAVEYELHADNGLTVRVTASNPGPRTAPYGHGAHPYITAGQPIDSCTVTVPGDAYLPVDDRMIPRGSPVEVTRTGYDLREPTMLGDRRIDNAYTWLRRDAAGRAWVRLAGAERAVSFWIDDAHPWIEIYTADGTPEDYRRLGLGVEPMTCPPNGFASGVDLIDLKPGDTTTGSWGIISG